MYKYRFSGHIEEGKFLKYEIFEKFYEIEIAS